MVWQLLTLTSSECDWFQNYFVGGAATTSEQSEDRRQDVFRDGLNLDRRFHLFHFGNPFATITFGFFNTFTKIYLPLSYHVILCSNLFINRENVSVLSEDQTLGGALLNNHLALQRTNVYEATNTDHRVT